MLTLSRLINIKVDFATIEVIKSGYDNNALNNYYMITQIQRDQEYGTVETSLAIREKFERELKYSRKIENENSELGKKAETDKLTGLPNRASFDSYVVKAFSRCQKTRRNFGIEILDIDYFKQYNDNYGHQKGDKCIKEVAEVLHEVAKKYNVYAARYGGDEFVIVYQGKEKEEMRKCAGSIKYLINKKAIEHKYSKAKDTVSVTQGLCYGIPNKGEKYKMFLKEADNLLYEVKQNTRDNYTIEKHNA